MKRAELLANTTVLKKKASPWKLSSPAALLSIKRFLDFLISLSVLVLFFPLFILLFLLIRTTSPGKALIVQERIGKGGVPFKCYKFRTMADNAPEMLEKILAENPSYKKEWIERRKLINDPRITRVGHFLRRYSLDELPQFWNVLKGDLSIVGPRPVTREEILQYFGPHAHEVFKVKPGITGLWQLLNRADMTYQERVEIEKRYVRNASTRLDLKVMLLTLPVIAGCQMKRWERFLCS